MRWRILIFGLPLVAGFSVIVALWIFSGGGDEPQPPMQGIYYPLALSDLFPEHRGSLSDLTVDDEGIVWFPVLRQWRSEGSPANSLYRYDPVTDSLQIFPLPAGPGKTYVASIEAGKGAREGKILVAWESTLLEVDRTSGDVNRLSVPFDRANIFPINELGPQPSEAPIQDIAVDEEGNVWISRQRYAYLIVIPPRGEEREFALPEEAGTPNRLALDAQGQIWATLFHHPPIPRQGGGTLYDLAFTLRFDPATERFDVLPWEAKNIAGGSKVVATGGDEPAAVRRFDVPGGTPQGLAEFGPVGRGASGGEVAVGPAGDVWYFSYSKLSLVRLADSGGSTTFALPTFAVREYLRAKCGFPGGGTPPPDCYEMVTRTDHVGGIAVAPDGSAWFAAGDSIGHAVP